MTIRTAEASDLGCFETEWVRLADHAGGTHQMVTDRPPVTWSRSSFPASEVAAAAV